MSKNLSELSSISPGYDIEEAVLAHLIRGVQQAGFQVDPKAITNLYVSLKSNPLAVLIVPDHLAAQAVIECFGQTMTNHDPLRFQTMVGHAWWANRNENAALFTEAQTLWNTGKLFELVHEASQPENRNRVYAACMNQISSAELVEFFSGMAFQLQRGRIIRIGEAHLLEPISFPPNMFLIATMDAERFMCVDDDVLAQTSLIDWNPENQSNSYTLFDKPARLNDETTFLEFCLRNTQYAFEKLQILLKSQNGAIFPLINVINVLKRYQIPFPQAIMREAIIFLANSWSQKGVGLFSEVTKSNLSIALDLAIVQYLFLPFQKMLGDSVRLHRHLCAILDDRSPRSTAFLESMS